MGVFRKRLRIVGARCSLLVCSLVGLVQGAGGRVDGREGRYEAMDNCDAIAMYDTFIVQKKMFISVG